MTKERIEKDSLGTVHIPSEKLWGAQTQRCLNLFRIGSELVPRELIFSYAVIKKAAAWANFQQGLLAEELCALIASVCDEILEGTFDDQFPLHIWMSGSGTQLNMNLNEVIANRCSQKAGKALGSKDPIHPNDHVNMSQSSNDTFPTAMHIAAVQAVKGTLLSCVAQLRESLNEKARAWKDVVKLGRTHLQDAVPLTVGQEFSGYVAMLDQGIRNLEQSVSEVYALTTGGTAVGTGLNTLDGFDRIVVDEIARITKMPFVLVDNKFAAQGAHNALVQLSGSLKALAVSLYKISNDIRLLSCGPQSGFYELILPSNEPGSSIMPGKVNPTQCEMLCMLALQVMANDVAISCGGAGGFLELNVYKPLIIQNLLQSIRLLSDGCAHFEHFLVREMKLNNKKIEEHVNRSVMLATVLNPVIGYDKAAKLVQYALEHDCPLREAAVTLNLVTESEYDRAVDPKNMCHPKNR